MSAERLGILGGWVLALLCTPSASLVPRALAQGEPAPGQANSVVFMLPASGASEEDSLPLYELLGDAERVAGYRAWLDNPEARWALDLYASARRIAIARDPEIVDRQPAAYYVALVPGGNHADRGFRLRTSAGIEDHPGTAFIRLGPDEWRFDNTFLHETAHVVMHVLFAGRRQDAVTIAPISHTTAALTDRETAFQEGYAIHLETVMARLNDLAYARNRYFHEQMLFGEVSEAPRVSEYYHQLRDLLSFAQTTARYHEVVENSFAFQSAWKGPDYLRVQLEKTRDYAELRSANQLLQSEGFYASFFYALLFRGRRLATVDTVRARQERVLHVLMDVVDRPDPTPNRPYLLEFVVAYRDRFAGEYRDVLDVLLDLSHGVFVDPEARTTWRTMYLAALRLDMEQLDLAGRERRRQAWRDWVTDDPSILFSRLGPELACRVIGSEVRLVAFGAARPLSFDLNSAEEGMLRLVPNITEMEVARWLEARDESPFSNFADFLERVALSDAVRDVLRCETE